MEGLIMIQVSPSVLAADFSRLGEEILDVYRAGASMIHLDVMDGAFVNNISFGIPVISSIRKVCDIVFDVHLMIEKPERYIKQFAQAGADLITIHYEACDDVENTLKSIRSYGKKSALSVKPGTPIDVVFPFLTLCDMILMMTVQPGFGGQSFMYDRLDKIRILRDKIRQDGYVCDIQVDGGVNEETAKLCVNAGANILVAGSAVFRATNRKKVISILKGEMD
jgi:ribulose-phosphate 3-epimerase